MLLWLDRYCGYAGMKLAQGAIMLNSLALSELTRQWVSVTFDAYGPSGI